jgi:hypothetical protein
VWIVPQHAISRQRAALLRKYSAELRAYSNEVRKQVELILKKHTSPPHRTTQDHGFLLPRPEA